MVVAIVIAQIQAAASPLPTAGPANALNQWNLYNDIVKAWGPVLIGIGAIVATFGAQLVLLAYQRKQFRSQNDLEERRFGLAKSLEEREQILETLNNFYGPIKELRSESVMFYRRFGIRLQKEFREQGKRFRTLRYLLQKGALDTQDHELLQQILLINDKILGLIENQSGVLDSSELQVLLGKLGAHIRVLKLASEGKLSGPADLFEDIVFPLALDGALESATLRLQDRLKQLGGSTVSACEPLRSVEPTISYYNENAEKYASQTRYVDMSDLYRPFRELVAHGGRILDAGCGVGRDTRYFIEHGYTVISFDASAEMVNKCLEYPHAYCLRMNFERLDFKETFDGVWACASLLHLSVQEAEAAVRNLSTALRPEGILFLSLREPVGDKHSSDDGARFFQYYTPEMVDTLIKSDFRLARIKLWETSSKLGNDSGKWVNILAKKRADVAQITG